MIQPTYYTLGALTKTAEPAGFKAAMMVRDLVSATHELVNTSTALLKSEIDDIELAHARLSMIIQRICNGNNRPAAKSDSM